MQRQGPSIRVRKMKPHDLESMSVDELWSLREIVGSVLERKISAEKARLEQRLREIGQSALGSAKKVSHARRPYPQVLPKYRNPAQPSETWAGRGKQPRWLTAQLRSGKKLDDFRIQASSDRRGAAARGSGRPNKKTARRRSA
jgi:DNA-binding protein H-NS